MPTPTLATYHETLSAALCALQDYMMASRIIPASTDWDNPFQFSPINYGTTRECHFELASYKNKPTRRWGHATIWRSEKGRYEINFYAL